MKDSVNDSDGKENCPKLAAEDFETFLLELAESCHNNEDILRRARTLLHRSPPNTLTANEVVIATMEEARRDAMESANHHLSERCLRQSAGNGGRNA
jgi:hypothetical protein